MKLLDRITSERAFYQLIIFAMIAIPAFEFLTEIRQQVFIGQPTLVELIGLVALFMAWLSIMVRKDQPHHLTDVIFLLLLLFAIISLTLSENPANSLFGYEYDEWITHFFAYFSLMYAGTMIRNINLRKNMIKAFIFVFAIQSFMAVLQSFGIRVMDCQWDSEQVSAMNLTYGLTSHFNWFSALMTLLCGCVMSLAILARSRKTFLIFLACTAISIYVMLSTETRLAIVSIAVLLIFFPVSLLIYNKVNPTKGFLKSAMLRWLIVLLAAVIVGAVIVFCFGRYQEEWVETVNEIDMMEGEPGFDEFAHGRGRLWRYGLACVPDHWAFGVGLDNYLWVFDNAPGLPHDLTWTNAKAHNEFIHYLVTQGVFQFITYVTLIVYTFVVGIKSVLRSGSSGDKDRRDITWICLAMFTAYVIQSLCNSSIVNIAPYFWITIGLILCKDDQPKLSLNLGSKAAGKPAPKR